MYKRFFELKDRPFKLVPDPGYLFMSRGHEEALAHLKFAISQGEGFVAITGEIGTGKTTLCRVFLESLDEGIEAAYIFNPKLDPVQLLKAVNDDFGISSSADNVKDLTDVLNAFLMEEKAQGKGVLLLIDEAQNLSKEVLEQLRLLSNLETTKSKLLQIILVGQPELGEALDSRELRQLAQRITLRCHLSPLNISETKAYIRHRIQIASRGVGISFSPVAFRRIHRYSGGIPRLINIVCERALLTAFVVNRRRVTGKVVKSAIGELSVRSMPPARGNLEGSRLIPVAFMVFLLLLAAVAYLPGKAFIRGILVPEKAKHAGVPVLEPVPQVVKKAGVREVQEKVAAPVDLVALLRGTTGRSSRRSTLGLVASLWGVPVDASPDLDRLEDDPTFFRMAARQSGLLCSRLESDLSMLMRLNLPAVLLIRLPEDPSPRYAALIRVVGDRVGLKWGTWDGEFLLDKGLLERCWSGTAYLLWKDFLALDDRIFLRSKVEQVLALKTFMKSIGFQIPVSPVYDESTRESIKEFQRKYGLASDGIIGPLTKIALYNEKPSFPIPHLSPVNKERIEGNP